ncbi:MAG: oligosaccharide flippase family protein [Anaerolineae bacterium]|nr:oligosaccharide flippase family protein [Anaerolineae bacterium]
MEDNQEIVKENISAHDATKHVDMTEPTSTSRTQRAKLTFMSTLLQQAAQVFVGFVITPIIIRGLGVELYGASTVIRQAVDYLSLGDLRVSSALKLTFAISQHEKEFSAKRRQIGAAILIWLSMLPLLGMLGWGLVTIAPLIVRVSSQYNWQIQAGMALAVLNVCLTGLLSIPYSVLRGMNFDYKAMGLNAAMIILVGILNVAAIYGGLGLPGVIGATVVGAIMGAVIRSLVAHNVLPWFGAQRPNMEDVRKLFGVSWWVFGSTIAYLLLTSTDYILIGALIDARQAGIFATTSLALRMLSGPVIHLLSSGAPGIGELWGRKEIERISNLRVTMQGFAIFSMLILGVGVLALNNAFLYLWVGDGFYAGNWVNLLLVILTIQETSTRVDIVLVDYMLEIPRRTLVMLLAGTISIVLAFLFVPLLGLVGIVLANFIGRSILTVFLTSFVSRRLGLPIRAYWRKLARLIFCGAFLLAVGTFISLTGRADTWLTFFMKAAIVGILATGVLWIIGLTQEQRSELLQFARIDAVLSFLKRDKHV